jgi:hypothetical protein
MDSKWREILEKVERGELTPEEGAAEMAKSARPITAQPASPSTPTPPSAELAVPPTPAQADSEPEVVEDFESVYAFWRNWWVLPLSVGALIFVVGAVLVALGNQPNQGFWLFCGLFPLLLGLGVMFVSFWSRTARWLHVRVREHKGDHLNRVAISMPIPIQLIGWGLKTFGSRIPGLRERPELYKSIPDILRALDKNGDPLVIEVNEKNGDEVRVYIM